MLARLAATIGQRHTLGAGNPATAVEVGEGTTLVLDENCTVSLFVVNLSDALLISHSRLCEYPATYIIHVTTEATQSPSTTTNLRQNYQINRFTDEKLYDFLLQQCIN
jgi:hypothetical protein